MTLDAAAPATCCGARASCSVLETEKLNKTYPTPAVCSPKADSPGGEVWRAVQGVVPLHAPRDTARCVPGSFGGSVKFRLACGTG